MKSSSVALPFRHEPIFSYGQNRLAWSNRKKKWNKVPEVAGVRQSLSSKVLLAKNTTVIVRFPAEQAKIRKMKGEKLTFIL